MNCEWQNLEVILEVSDIIIFYHFRVGCSSAVKICMTRAF